MIVDAACSRLVNEELHVDCVLINDDPKVLNPRSRIFLSRITNSAVVFPMSYEEQDFI
jgi:hypothetical protein